MKAFRKILHFGCGVEPRPFQVTSDYVQISGQEANDRVFEAVTSDRPLMVAKFGTVELDCVRNHLAIQASFSPRKAALFLSGRCNCLWWWEPALLNALEVNAGVFPATSDIAERFATRMLQDVMELDILASYIPEEKEVEHLLPPRCLRIDLDGYYAPFKFRHPWTRALEGKKVLVVHPFESSIRSQYSRRSELWDDSEVLPRFELMTLRAVQSHAGCSSEYPDWFAALDHMERLIASMDFDVALVGCGAYGLPLCAHIKRLGKKAIHLAGWTQILFGIYGSRWERDPGVAPFIKSSWIRPSAEETPPRAGAVEGGCYW